MLKVFGWIIFILTFLVKKQQKTGVKICIFGFYEKCVPVQSISYYYSFYSPSKDERLSRPWSGFKHGTPRMAI